jgi:arylamine N-acetyltransferase
MGDVMTKVADKTFLERLRRIEAPSIVFDRAIDLERLGHLAGDDNTSMDEVLHALDLNIEVLLARMASEAPKAAAARAHTLAVTADEVGAWKLADAAREFERAATAPGPVTLVGSMNHLSRVATETQMEIRSLTTH